MAFWTAARIKTDASYRLTWGYDQHQFASRTISHVERQGFTWYLPSCHPSRRPLKSVPLFPGYLFVKIEDRWRCLLGTSGVINVICNGGHPAVVREDEIARIRRQENRDTPSFCPCRVSKKARRYW